ncbi:LOW QUALITY PROTEIN: phosphatidylglycerophosphatase A [Vibrio sp. JCM 19053]|nr:LOW QUALITY PROTEIN: phosphatidylglycerophosphatase A [Vibrio sp. JCM 19053]
MTNPLSLISLKNPWHLLATGFGSGLSPFIPGTMGTLAAVPFFLLLAQLPFTAYVIVVLISCVIGIQICQVTSADMKVHDHGSIVWDEFAGFWITMSIVPALNIPLTEWKWLITGFILFRFFDMVNLGQLGGLDKRVHGGLGIMVDDIVAGIMAGVALFLVAKYAGWMN